MKITGTISLAAALALIGCTTQVPLVAAPENLVQYPVESAAHVKLTAVGYGAASSAEAQTPGQRRLLAMRASRLDAYRSLAEQVYGVRLMGNTTVSSLMSQNDSFRAYIDAYLRGARVISVTPMADGNYETTIEIDFDDRIARPYLTPAPAQPVLQPAVKTYVAQPVTVPSYTVAAQPVAVPSYTVAAQPRAVAVVPTAVASPAPVYVQQPVAVPTYVHDGEMKGAVGPGRTYGSTFYYAE